MTDPTDEEIDTMARDAKPDHDLEATERVRDRLFPTAKEDTRAAFIKWRDNQRYVSEEGCWNAGVEWALASAGVERLRGQVEQLHAKNVTLRGDLERMEEAWRTALRERDRYADAWRTGEAPAGSPVPVGSPALRVPEEWPSREELLDGLARTVEGLRDAVVRSKSTMTVDEHRRLMTAAADSVRKGLVTL